MNDYCIYWKNGFARNILKNSIAFFFQIGKLSLYGSKLFQPTKGDENKKFHFIELFDCLEKWEKVWVKNPFVDKFELTLAVLRCVLIVFLTARTCRSLSERPSECMAAISKLRSNDDSIVEEEVINKQLDLNKIK